MKLVPVLARIFVSEFDDLAREIVILTKHVSKLVTNFGLEKKIVSYCADNTNTEEVSRHDNMPTHFLSVCGIKVTRSG